MRRHHCSDRFEFCKISGLPTRHSADALLNRAHYTKERPINGIVRINPPLFNELSPRCSTKITLRRELIRSQTKRWGRAWRFKIAEKGTALRKVSRHPQYLIYPQHVRFIIPYLPFRILRTQTLFLNALNGLLRNNIFPKISPSGRIYGSGVFTPVDLRSANLSRCRAWHANFRTPD